MINTAESFGSRIKAMREHCGFSQSNIANYLKVDQSLISMAESGKRAVTSDMLEKLATLFGVSLSTFNDGEIAVKPISCAFRASEINEEDLEVISAINRIALNSTLMTQLLEGGHTNG